MLKGASGEIVTGIPAKNGRLRHMAKIFITGVSGFFGGNLASYLRRKGHEVAGGSRTTNKERGIDAFDLGSVDGMYQVLALHQPDIIIHAAALSSVTDGCTLDYYQVNTLGTENLLNAVDRLQKRIRFIYISTAGVYGSQATEILHEDLVPNPVSHYGISKYAAECLVRAEFSKRHDVMVIRPFNIIGVGQKLGFIFPKIVRHFKNRMDVIRLGNLEPRRDYLDVESCCNYTYQLISNPKAYGAVVNMCSNHGTSVRQLVDTMVKITKHPINIEVAPEFVRTNEVWSLVGSDVLLKKLCGEPVALNPIESVLEAMIDAE